MDHKKIAAVIVCYLLKSGRKTNKHIFLLSQDKTQNKSEFDKLITRNPERINPKQKRLKIFPKFAFICIYGIFYHLIYFRLNLPRLRSFKRHYITKNTEKPNAKTTKPNRTQPQNPQKLTY